MKNRSIRRRPLLPEHLESRQMLAGDGCEPLVPITPTANESPSVLEIAQEGALVAMSDTVSALDAGSTAATAADLGVLDGSRQLSGSLGWFDQVDTLRFTLPQDGQFSAELSGLRRDADLFVTDGSGRLIASSVLGGRNVDSVEVRLPAGEYFVSIVAQSFWSNRYSLSLNVQLDPIVETIPQQDPDGESENDNATDDSFQLSEVAYFGGAREWNVNAVAAPEAWASGYTGQGVTVAIVDTGVDLDHPDLVSNLFVNPGEIAGNGIDDDGNGFVDDVHGYDFADDDANPNDTRGHGTHVAGTIAAANNGFGATGIAPDATILPVRVLGNNGSGSSFDVAAGIRYAADLGADIINLSLGGGFSRSIDAAIEYAKSLGTLIVAAAGNESASVPSYPARFGATDDNVISVGAHDSSSRLAGFSNQVGGSGTTQIDAPGVGIYSTYVGGRYATLSGTSMAAPHVAGLAALTLSADPDLTASELKRLLADGTVGQAGRSDSIGLASALTTVAHAAAGSVINPNAATGSSASTGVATSTFAARSTFRFTAAPTSVVSVGATAQRASTASVHRDLRDAVSVVNHADESSGFLTASRLSSEAIDELHLQSVSNDDAKEDDTVEVDFDGWWNGGIAGLAE